jgi:4-amino-4-deoxy-L-arabinose transferase-like glycosyltransferase
MNTYLANVLKQPKKLFLVFLGITLIVNLLQAYLTGLHPDEAYYWVYAQFLDWGYFDHPPFVAIYIKIGSLLFKNTLGLRLLTVISYTASILLLWQIVKKYGANVKLFIILVSAVLIFHVYAFITTPDVPLLFFSILFLLLYQLYLKEDKTIWAIALGFTAAGLMLSKYHGILLIILVLLSNLKLFTRRTFYITIVLAVVLCLPHLYWQYLNGFPSFYYHLIDRSATPYRFDYTTQYFLDQVLMMGPLVGWLLFYYAYKAKTNEDLFIKALKFVSYGVIIFFFFSTFKGRVQAQWPLIEFTAIFILAYIYAVQHPQHFKKYKWLFGANIFLIVLARFIIMSFIPGLDKIKFVASFKNFDVWAQEIAKVAQGNPIIFEDGFQQPSYFNFYTQSLNAVAYNSVYYRQTQYDLWPLEDSVQHKKVMLIRAGEATLTKQKTINTIKGPFHYTWIDSVQFYPKINFKPIDFSKKWAKNEERTINFTVVNPYDKSINFKTKSHKWPITLQYGYLKDGKVIEINLLPYAINKINLSPKTAQNISLKIKAPSAEGNYKLFISIKTDPFAGTRNSKMIGMKVE